MTFDFTKYKDSALTRPRDEAWGNWKSWKNSQIGDKVEGYVADAFYRPEELNNGTVVFREQRGITIKQTDGTLINVGVKFLEFILKSTDNLRVGDPIVVELIKIEQPKAKGQNGAKVFGFYGANLPENANNKTVKELTDEDKASGGTAQPDEVKQEESSELTADDLNSDPIKS